MPRQENFAARIDVTHTECVPPISETADHIVEFDLTSSGRIKLQGSGGSGELEIEIPPGKYRARLNGFDFEAAKQWSYDDPGNPPDHYHLELWPSDVSEPPVEVRRWAGYAERL